MEQIIEAISALRAPLQQGEYDLHRLVMDALDAASLPWEHEVRLAPRCRIDLMCGGVGIEIKRGAVDKRRVLAQVRRLRADMRADPRHRKDRARAPHDWRQARAADLPEPPVGDRPVINTIHYSLTLQSSVPSLFTPGRFPASWPKKYL